MAKQVPRQEQEAIAGTARSILCQPKPPTAGPVASPRLGWSRLFC